MDKEKVIEVAEALADFVTRVAKREATSKSEVAVLPEVAKTLLTYYSILNLGI